MNQEKKYVANETKKNFILHPKNKEKHNGGSCERNKQPKTETNVFPTDLFHYSLRCFHAHTVVAFVRTSLARLCLFKSSVRGQTLARTPTNVRAGAEKLHL